MRMQTKPTDLTLKGLEQRVVNLERGFKRFMAAAGLSLAGLLTFAFFLGSLHAKVSDSADKIDKLYNVVAVDKDSLQSRVSVMENRLSSIDSRLNSMDADLKELKKHLNERKKDLDELKELIKSRYVSKPVRRSR